MPGTELLALMEKLHARESGRRLDHFEILGLSHSATFQDIEDAYRRLSELFSDDRLEALGSGENADKARDLRRRFDHAHEVLTDYAKRQDYENRGFKEAGDEEKIENPADTARKIFVKTKFLLSTKQYALGLEVIDKAIAIDPQAGYYHLRGLCLMNIPHRRHEAEAVLLKAAELEPWNAEHSLALGTLFYMEKLPKRAMGYFRKTLELDAGNLQARKKLDELEGPRQEGLKKLQTDLLRALRNALPSFLRGR